MPLSIRLFLYPIKIRWLSSFQGSSSLKLITPLMIVRRKYKAQYKAIDQLRRTLDTGLIWENALRQGLFPYLGVEIKTFDQGRSNSIFTASHSLVLRKIYFVLQCPKLLSILNKFKGN